MTSDRERPTVLVDERRIVDDRYVIRVRILAVPRSEDYPEGVKYSMHYGTLDGDTILRYDNAHGRHERHRGTEREDIEFPGFETLYRRFSREIDTRETGRTRDYQ